MTVAEFLADRPDWLPEPTRTWRNAIYDCAEWNLSFVRNAVIFDDADGVMLRWQDGTCGGWMVVSKPDLILDALRQFFPPTAAEQLAMLPRIITGSADKQ